MSFPKFPLPKLTFFRQVFSSIINHKILTVIFLGLILFCSFALNFRSNLVSQLKLAQKKTTDISYLFYSPLPATNPDTNMPTPTPDPTDTAVLGTSTDNSNTVSDTTYTPTPTPSPAPSPSYTPATTTSSSTTSNSSSSNSNCSTSSGVANSWYSDVYPPGSTTVGNTATVSITIRDCNISPVFSTETLNITLNSGDSSIRVNGQSLPTTITTQNGQASFSVTSQNPTTANFTVHDQTSGFDVTTTTNSSPSVTFTSNSSSGNSNCTSAAGVVNSWYTDVYPPSSTDINSSANFTITLRDCSQNTVSSANDSLAISLVSGDSSTQINGQSPPVTISASAGQASFSVTSQVSGTVTLKVHDNTNNFDITTTSNGNPSVSFTGTVSNPSPSPSPSPSPTDSPSPSPTSNPSPTSSTSPSPSPS